MSAASAARQMRFGVPASTFMGDPRLSKAQMDAIESTCKSDSGARLLGLDQKLRPVVRARVGIPREVRTWALLRNGDPTDAALLNETWQERVSR